MKTNVIVCAKQKTQAPGPLKIVSNIPLSDRNFQPSNNIKSAHTIHPTNI